MFAVSADVAEKFAGDPPGGGGDLPPRSVIVGVGPPVSLGRRSRRDHFERCQRPQRLFELLARLSKPRLIDQRHARLLTAPIRVVAEQGVRSRTCPWSGLRSSRRMSSC
jgi:hypothetical protein